MKIKPNKRAGIGLLALGLIGGLGAIGLGIGVGIVVYHLQSKINPRPVMVTNINGLAQSPFEVGSSK